jgi:tetratricopeptide (TPR) repeat protein
VETRGGTYGEAPDLQIFSPLIRNLRRHSALLAALLGLVLAGCGDRDRTQLPAETDDPFYVQGKQLQKQSRNTEALNAFLKVIDRRGENPSPESHLEVGLICLHHTKDPLSAIYHLRRYLKVHPNSKQAPYVLGQIEAARREFAAALPGRPLDDQSVRLGHDEELRRLRRENEELRAEVAVLRGGAVVPPARAPRMISLPAEMQPRVAAVTPPVATVVDASGAPVAREPAPAPVIERAPPPARPAPATPAAPSPKAASGRTHTVAAKDTLFSISRRYNVSVADLVAANRAQVPAASSPLRIGMVLRIP